eukprot:gene55842-74570_t
MDSADATVNGHPLPGNVFASIGGIQQSQTFQVLVIAQATQGRSLSHVVGPQFFEQDV